MDLGVSETRKSWRTYALIVRANPEEFVKILDFLRSSDDVFLVYFRASDKKIIFSEVPF